MDNNLAKRSSTIITKTDCEFIVLKKDAYMKISEAYNNEFNAKKDFLMGALPNFGSLKQQHNKLEAIYEIKQIKRRRDNFIYEQDDLGNSFFII